MSLQNGVRTLHASHGNIVYSDQGSGPPIVLLHGMNGSYQSWPFQFDALSDSFRIIAWDAPGFGGSDPCAGTMQAYAGAAREMLTQIGVKDAIILGHSMGGLIAAQLAAEQKGLVAGLILSGTHHGYGRPAGEPLMARYSDRVERIQREGAGPDYGKRSASKMVPEGTSEQVLQKLAEVAAGARAEGLRDAGRMMQETDNRKIAAHIKVPILILAGQRDPVVSAAAHAALCESYPQAKRIYFPQAGHAAYVEYPDLYNAEVRDFANNIFNQITQRDRQ
jgi:pimeloyl-ACP methyl ester carboxylesterase